MMATFSILLFFSPFFFLIFNFVTPAANPVPTFSYETFHDNPDINSEISLFGDAKIINGDSSVKLTNPSVSSSGLLMYKKPITFHPTNPRKNPTSFSTDFSFSISPENGDGIAFVIVPTGFASRFSGNCSFGLSRENKFLGIEFDTAMDDKVGDLNGNHVGIDVDSLISVSTSNVSSIDLVLNSGKKLQSWIDYESSSKRLEVRLGEFGSPRPYNPLVAHSIDLSEMWKEEEVFVGISSSTSNSLQTSSIYSWKFREREISNLMHSQPIDPRVFSKEQGESLKEHKKSLCPMTILAGLIFATGCGALIAFVVLFFWVMFVSRHTIDYPASPVDFRYEKVNVVVEESSDVEK